MPPVSASLSLSFFFFRLSRTGDCGYSALPRRDACFVLGDRIRILQREADVVESVKQAMAAEGVYLESRLQTPPHPKPSASPNPP